MSWYGQHPEFTKAEVLAAGTAPARACRATLYRARCAYQISGTCTGCARDQGTRLALWRAKYRGQRGRFVLRDSYVEWRPETTPREIDQDGDETVYATGGFVRTEPFIERDIRAAVATLREQSQRPFFPAQPGSPLARAGYSGIAVVDEED